MEQFLRGFFDKLKEQNVLDEIIPNANMMIKYLLKYEKIHPKNPQIKTIKDSLRKIKNNPNPFNTNEQFVLYKKNIINTFKAIEIYSRSMVQATTEKEKRIEQQLFDISFVLGENYETKILPVYLLHDDFLNATESICSLKSSTGSGKTRCAPFFFTIKTIKTNMEQPFFIMTQPSTTIINDKIEDFQNIIGNSVTLISNDIYKFKQFFSSYTLNPRTITKPIVALFTPHKLARLFAEIETIYECSRFVLDEIHERSVETDVVTAILAQKLRTSTIPLHLLMMTATPDIRITNLFKGYHYKNFELENSLLFPIEDIKIEVPNFNKIDETAQYETMEIIKKMDSKQIKIGHILIFTSGNRRINNIIDLISREIKKMPKSIQLLRINEKLMKDQTKFYSFLDDKIQEDNDSLYIILMKYAGFLKPEEKEIRKNPIPNHPNIVKIIIATNAIESSITIDGLAAVIDCGIFNQPILDKEKGILKLEENPISIQSQTQRRGRVGRKMEGICVQLTIKNHPPVELVSPAIEKEDISLSVLSLRRIGIKLEKIKNLPEPGVKPIEMTNYLNELRSYGAIDSNGNLTGKGWQLNYFSPLLPFVATSIFEVSQKYRNQENISKIVGSLVFLILSTKDLIVDKLSKELRRNFNPDSDIITILKTIIEVMKENGSSKAIFSKYGFHPANALRMIGDFEKIVSNIYGNKDKPSWNDIDHFCRHIKMMEFIQMILNQIETHKRKWASCRRAQYHTVSNMLNEYSFIYKGDTSLIEENDAYQEIIMKMRPGATGLASPGQCYIFQISKSENNIFFLDR